MQLLTQTSVQPQPRIRISRSSKLRVGVVGYSGQTFNQETALSLIRDAFDSLDRATNVEIISGLTRLGIPALAYEEAVRRGWRTVGVACTKAFEYEWFPVDEAVISGISWGDESPTFLSMIDVLIRVGGGEQSHREVDSAKIQDKCVMEYELPTLSSD